MTFREVESLLGFALPVSARKYSAWWANLRSHSQAHSWLDVGYNTETPDLKNERITLKKFLLKLFVMVISQSTPSQRLPTAQPKKISCLNVLLSGRKFFLVSRVDLAGSEPVAFSCGQRLRGLAKFPTPLARYYYTGSDRPGSNFASGGRACGSKGLALFLYP